MATVRIEAESMNRSVYRLESNQPFASNDAFVSLLGGGSNTETGTISTVFNGASGTYDISVAYFDENDGASNYSLTVGGAIPYTWIGNDNTDFTEPGASNIFRTQVFSNVTIQNGDLISITGSEDGGEPARIDYIELTGDALQPPAWAGSNGIIELMPLGDSITRGADPTVAFGQQNGYRDNLQTLLGSTGLNFDFVGSLTHGQSGFDRNHEGHGGWTISEISAAVNDWLDSFQPEIVLLKIGTNDIGFSPTGQQGGELSIQAAIDQLSSLIDQIFTRVPATRIVVSSIAPAVFDDIDPNLFGLLPNFEQRVIDFNALIPGLVTSKITQGKLVSFTDSFGALDPAQHISSDGVHPNESGYAQIAGVFNTAVQNLLSTTPDGTENMTAFPASFDLSSLATGDGSNGFVINGVNSYDQSGFSVSDAGDINGDGFDDIVIGILNETYGSSTEGYVIFGSSNSFGASIDLAGLNSPGGPSGLVLLGDGNVGFGDKTSVSAAGDINGDGVDDLIIGKSGDSPYATYNAGQSYVIFGQSAGFSNTSIDLTSLDGTNGGLIISGVNDYDASGFSVSSAGDVNGDGIDDLIIGAPYAQSNGGYSAGKTYIVFGSTTDFDENLDLSILDGSNGFILNGIDANNNNDLSGSAVSSAGDVNGDGIDDLIVSAKQAAPDNDTYAGETYVIFGTATPFASEQVNLADLNTTGGPSGFLLKGTAPFDYSGTSVSAAGDINGDGIDDIIVGAPYTAGPNGNDGAGKSYVIFGNANFSATYELADVGTASGPNGFIINGANSGDSSGVSVSSAGDLNGDGISDIIIGARDADSNSIDNAGAAYVVYGTTAPFSQTLNLATLDGTTGFVLRGIDTYDYAGLSVNSAGDINGDGIDDIVIGARYGDPGNPANTNAGETYVVFGRLQPPVVLGISNDTDIPGDGNTTDNTLIFMGTGVANSSVEVFIDDIAIGSTVAANTGDWSLDYTSTPLSEATYSITAMSTDINGNVSTLSNSFVLTISNGITGTANGETLIGTNAKDSILGLGGNDAILGLDDDDIILGDDGNDFLDGGNGNDTINGGNGSDNIKGREGNDTLNGEAGNDIIEGGVGNDTLTGGAENDSINGGDGLDMLNGGTGNDYLYGLADNDTLTGGDGIDFLFGGDGEDSLNGNAGVDALFGGNGADELFGGDDNDRLYGDEGADTLEGGNGNDYFEGGIAGDTLSGGNDNDVLKGQDGDDTLNGDAGEDRLEGGDGNDTLNGGNDNDILNSGNGDDVLNGGDGNDTIYGIGGNDTLNGNDGDDLLLGLNDDDTIYGNDGIDNLFGGNGNDNLFGNNGNDVLSGEAGNDSLSGDNGNDFLDGGSGSDTLSGGNDDDRLKGQAGIDALNGNDGNDTLEGGENDDILNGDNGNDILNGGNGDDVLNGGNDDDFLYGLEGNDSLNGGSGRDFLYGSNGNDSLSGGDGNDVLFGGDLSISVANQIDTLTGGNGTDRFVVQNIYNASGDTDYALITDFDTTSDFLELGNGMYDVIDTTGALPAGAGIYDAGGDLVAVIQGFDENIFSTTASYIATNYA